MDKIVVITSGGMDSTVLLHSLKAQGHEVRALAINYGQRHGVELSYAAWQANRLGVPFQIADLRSLREILPNSSQTDDRVKVPHGHYAEENMKATVVPNRNMILLSVAIGHAIACDFDHVAFGAHAGDHAIYPDCRPIFAAHMNTVATLCHFTPVYLLRPFINITKTDIVKKGHELGVNFDYTWSCYEGGHRHCGRCGTCVERIQAFKEAGVYDPTDYTDAEFALNVKPPA